MAYKVIIGLAHWGLQQGVCAERLGQGLIKRGHDARILLIQSGCRAQQPPAKLVDPAIDLPIVQLPAGSKDSWGQRMEALERYLEENAPCIYLLAEDWQNNIIATRLSERIKVISLIHANPVDEIDQLSRLGSAIDAIVAISEPIQFRLVEQLSYLAQKVVTIPNAIPILPKPPSKPDISCLRIACISEFTDERDHLEDILLISNQLAAKSVPFHLTIFGDGPLNSSVKEKAVNLAKRGMVEFAGSLHDPEWLQALESQHVFLQVCEHDGLFLAALDAMSRGCVPIISNLSSHSHLVRDEMNALYVHSGDSEVIVEQLQRLQQSADLFTQLSLAAYQTITKEYCGEESVITTYLQLFENLLAEKSPNRNQRKNRFLSTPLFQDQTSSLSHQETEQYFHHMTLVKPWPNPPLDQKPARISQQQSTSPNKLANYKVMVSSRPGVISGVDVFAYHLVRGLRLRGVDAQILARCPDGQNIGAWAEDIPIVESIFDKNTEYLGFSQRWKLLARQLEEMGPCIYIPNYDYECSCIGPLLSSHVRMIGIGHSDDPWHYEHLTRIGESCNAIVGVSQAIIDHLGVLAPQFLPKLTYIPYGIPLPSKDSGEIVRKIDAQSGPMRILYSGRAVLFQKRVLDLMEIARLLQDRQVDFQLWVVGDGDIAQQMAWNNLDLIRAGYLHFYGQQSNDKVMKLMDECDVFILPSSFEGLSVAMLEAMSRGLVPVVSNIRSGVPEVINHGENGLIAPVGAYERFADHLEWLWRHPIQRKHMAENAIQTVSNHFSLELMLERYVALLEDVAAQTWERPRVPIKPPENLRHHMSWRAWAWAVATDPGASLNRIYQRFFSK